MPKYLKTKKQIFEFFNPVLGPNDFISSNNPDCPSDIHPAFAANADQCTDMYDKPVWLDPDEDVHMRGGDSLSIGAYYINGAPISSWGARVGGTSTQAYKQQQMQSFYHVQQIKKKLFPNGIEAFFKNKTQAIEELEITKLNIVQMNPGSSGIGLNITIKFCINDDENIIWGKFINYGLDLQPKFVCEEIESLSKENKIKITGKIKNILINWFKVKTGIYQLLNNELIVYTEFGQLKRLHEGAVIEVIYSDEDKITIIYDNDKYIIKKPNYYWFNWNFKNK